MNTHSHKMATKREIHHGFDYLNEEKMDPQKFLKMFKILFTAEKYPLYKDYVSQLHDVFQKVVPPGPRQLDFGCGPSIHILLSSSLHCDDIVCSEFSPNLRREVSKWVNQEPGATDWTYMLQYLAGLENSNVSTIEGRVRSSVKKIIPCNIFNNNNMLDPEVFPPFDLITSSCCLDVACPDLPTYKKCINNIYEMLAPGGVLVLNGIFGQSWYDVIDKRFWGLKYYEEDVREALREAGFPEPSTMCVVPVEDCPPEFETTGYFTLSVARQK